ncbi:unnamed protein product, partial [marine sediment metagenome]
GLCLFSNRIHLFIPPKKEKSQINLISDALYNIKYDYTETNHARCINYLSMRYRKRSLIIMLSDFVDIDTSEDMIESVISSARRNSFLFIGLRDPFIEARARQFPQSTPEAYHKAVAIELLTDRKNVLEKMRRNGVHVLDCEPDQLTAPMINKYLELTKLGVL